MNVLIACEESQRVCNAFRERGHNAFSCDLMPCSGGHPEWHIQQNALEILNPQPHYGFITENEAEWIGIEFNTMDGVYYRIPGKWDLIIAHPPCTFLTVAGNRWFNVEKYGDRAIKRIGDRREAIKFFMEFVSADCDKIAIENPIGVMSTEYKKPDQIIEPYYFGDPVRKSTCLWLKNLPPLKATTKVPFEIRVGGYSGPAWAARDENGKIIAWNDPRTAIIRSKTYPGIASAMAEQWG